MMSSNDIGSIMLAHLLQLSIAIAIVAGLARMTARKWPHFTFLLCMLALGKCVVPPLIPSPAGLFTLHDMIAFAPPGLSPGLAGDLTELEGEIHSGDSFQIDAIQSELSEGAHVNRWGIASWSICVLCLWGSGATLIILSSLRKYYQVVRSIKTMLPANYQLRQMVKGIREQLGMRQHVQVLLSPDNFGPACVGVFKPKLILPSAVAAGWSDRLLRPVIAHELIHARRCDVAWGYLQFAAQVIWWFHPLVWWIGRQAQIICERCCDEEVCSSLKCSAADYGESLVRVLELNTVFRPLPLGMRMSPAEITEQRLQNLRCRGGRFCRGTSRCAWIFLLIIAAVILPGMRWASISKMTVEEEAEFRLKINDAIVLRDWDAAVDMLDTLVEAHPEDGNAIFFLGYALHAGGRIDEAIQFHKRASMFPKNRPIALYNWACALALQGKREEALNCLEKSLEAGFISNTELADDEDFASISHLPRFIELNARCYENSALRLQPQVRVFVQAWTVMDSQGKIIAHDSSRGTPFSQAEPLSTERWVNPDGGETSISFCHLGNDKWRQAWVDGSGGVIEYEGAYVNGKMCFEGTMLAPGGKEIMTRMTFQCLSGGIVEQFLECSLDGKTWRTLHKRKYERKPVVRVAERTIGM